MAPRGVLKPSPSQEVGWGLAKTLTPHSTLATSPACPTRPSSPEGQDECPGLDDLAAIRPQTQRAPVIAGGSSSPLEAYGVRPCEGQPPAFQVAPQTETPGSVFLTGLSFLRPSSTKITSPSTPGTRRRSPSSRSSCRSRYVSQGSGPAPGGKAVRPGGCSLLTERRGLSPTGPHPWRRAGSSREVCAPGNAPSAQEADRSVPDDAGQPLPCELMPALSLLRQDRGALSPPQSGHSVQGREARAPHSLPP